MWPTTSLDEVFDRARRSADLEQPLGERLVSLVFAPPTSPIWPELRASMAYLDAQTGDAWDLFIAGVPSVTKTDLGSAYGNRPFPWLSHFQPAAFRRMTDEVHMHHRRALSMRGLEERYAWRHSGGTDVVSLMAYRGRPDWLSLTAARLDDPMAPPITLAELAARQTPWEQGVTDPEFSPGRPPQGPRLKEDLGRLLASSGRVIGAGMMGNAAYDLVKALLK